MTHETKLGLVVAGSFACLVGVVLFSKLNDSEEEKTSPAVDAHKTAGQPATTSSALAATPKKDDASKGAAAKGSDHTSPDGVRHAKHEIPAADANAGAGSRLPLGAPNEKGDASGDRFPVMAVRTPGNRGD